MKKNLFLTVLWVAGMMLAVSIPGFSATSKYVYFGRLTATAQKAEVERQVKEFNKLNPDIPFVYEAVEHEKQEPQLLVKIAGGDLPLVVHTAMALSKELYNKGLAADLTEYYDKYNWYDKIAKWAYDIFTDKEGRIYAVPYVGLQIGFFHYNVEMFREHGWEVPRWDELVTWEEFLELCEKIKQAGIIPIAMGNKEFSRLQHLTNCLLTQTLPVDEARALFIDVNGPKFTDPEPKRVFSIVYDLVEKGYFNPGINGTSDYEARGMLYAGKAAMYHSGAWFPRDFTQAGMEGKFEFDLFPLPRIRTDIPYNMALTAAGWTVNPEGDVEAAAKFIDWMLNLENQKRLVELGISSSIKGALTEENVVHPAMLKYPESVVRIGAHAVPEWEPIGAWVMSIRSLLQGLADGRLSPEECAQKFQEEKIRIMSES